ncbi:hypothetical protein C8Q75DRAFT_711061 [Abortiporus biennis]|nr:hypothetical protein C8Q75DRAFT_711061 [Abortiporus biennis]
MDFDLESLVHVEQSFYDEGYADGHAHGRIHGLIEGRALGREKGFEMWEEIGYYEGFALMLKSVYDNNDSNSDRPLHHITHLLDMINRFPKTNPSATEPSDLDIPKLFRQIRSRYKALCAVCGIKPTLRASDAVTPPDKDSHELGDALHDNTHTENSKKKVWSIEKPTPAIPDLSF